jgi:hypothetical protein
MTPEEQRAQVVALLGREPGSGEPMADVLLEAVAVLARRVDALELRVITEEWDL